MRKIRWPEPETWILIGCAIAFALFMFYVLTGCSTSKRAQKMDVVWHDGKCLLIVNGMSVTEAQTMMAEWQFKECEIVVEESESSGGKKPPKKEE